jgi:Ca2+-binding RTX toxin-like protein
VSNPTGVLPSTSYEFYYPTILLTLQVSELAYETLNSSSGVLTPNLPEQPSESTLLDAGWTPIVGLDHQTDSQFNYQGVAFYKLVDGVTEVVIGNRGTEGKTDFVDSDIPLATNSVPAADNDAFAYYGDVVNWLKANVSTPVNIIETGHSLGGQEADYVEVLATKTGLQFATEAVTFNAPGIPSSAIDGDSERDSPPIYNALNISASTELVHVAGAAFNAGYQGESVLVKAGTSLVPYAVEAAIGMLAGGAGIGFVIRSLANLAYTGFSANHHATVLDAYFKENPALGGVNLQTYQADTITQANVTYLEDNISAAAYSNDTPGQKAELYATLLGTTPTSNSSSGSINETFDETVVGGAIQFIGSNGDVVTIDNDNNTETVSDNHGRTDTLTFSSDGLSLVGQTWNDPDGTIGAVTFIPSDGSSTSTITYASGGYATILDDGQGNLTTDYFSKAGNEYAFSWQHSDGTSGEQTAMSNGLTTTGAGPMDVPTSSYETITNPDGTYTSASYNPANALLTQVFDADGTQTSSASEQGPGHNFDLSHTTPVTTSSDGYVITRVYDSAVDLVSDTWTNTDTGVSGSDTYNASGAVSGTTHNLNLTSSTYTLYPTAGGSATTYTPPGSPVPITVGGPYSLTTNNYDSVGSLTSDQWQLTDGAHGNDTFGTGGAGSGQITHLGGGTSSITIDGEGNIAVQNLASDLTVQSEDWWNADGSHGTILYADGQESASYSFDENGLGTETTYADDGSEASEDTITAGGYLSADGSHFGEVENSDDTYSVNYTDSNGDALIFNYSDAGVLLSADHASAAPVDDFAGTLSGGQAWTSTYNGSTPTYTDSDGTQWTLYLDGAGVETGDNWTRLDGTRGHDTFHSDGSSSGATYNTDGTSVTYETDGLGGEDVNYYDANGNVTNDTEVNADGSHGYDTYDSSGASSGRYYDASGSYADYVEDNAGDVSDSQYSSSGVLLSKEWSLADGTYADETVASDGTITGGEFFTGGAYTSFTIDPSGNTVSANYDPSGLQLSTGETFVDAAGDTASYIFSNAGDLTQETQTSSAGKVLSHTIIANTAETLDDLTVSSASGDSITVPDTGGVVLAWGANDTITAGSGITLIDAWGSHALLIGGSGADTLEAMGSHATLLGGLGEETFDVNDATQEVEAQAGAVSNDIFSSVSYVMPTHVQALTLTGSDNLTATGNSEAGDLITGNAGNDSLIAGAGADTLVSGTGIDTLIGGAGGDTYVINNAADVIEAVTGNTDIVQSSVSYTLTAAVGVLNLTGSGNLSATDGYGYAVITANAGHDTLTGGSGRDTLIAGSGIDTLIAGSGTNTLVLNNAADVVEGASAADTIEASFDYTMGGGVDNLVLTGSANLVATGNSDATNSISANSGIDTLIAGSGADTLIGHAGDTYVLNSGFGDDEIRQTGSGGTLEFGAGISSSSLEVGITTGTDGKLSLVIGDGSGSVTVDDAFQDSIDSFEFSGGDTLDFTQLVAQASATSATLSGAAGQIIFDNTPSASLSGGIGNDTIYAFGENDLLIAGSGNQQLYGENAGDVIAGGVGNDTLHGGEGDDTLIGGSGNTVMDGGKGNDFYQLTQGATATINEGSSAGTETIYLPTGMTMSDFIAIEGLNGSLILQSVIDNTSVVINGFYSSSSSNKTWLIADDTEDPQFLGHFVGAPITASSYTEAMTQLREGYAGELGATLNSLGESGGSIVNPGRVILPGTPGENYQFDGVTLQNVTVTQAEGVYVAGTSEQDTVSSSTTTSSTTRTLSTPIYTEETVGGGTYFVATSDAVDVSDETTTGVQSYNDEIFTPVTNSSGDVIGFDVTLPTRTELVQTGTQTTTITIPTATTVTNETQGFSAENIGTDGGNVSIFATAPFVGTVNTGDGNVNVVLGAWSTGETLDLGDNGHFAIEGPLFSGGDAFTPPLGAFIQAGSGNDSIVGTGGADVIAAGTGFDYLDGWMGTTYYVPMAGDSTDVIADDVTASPYGSGEYPETTLVLPEGVTPENLQYRIFSDPYANTPTDPYSQVLQLRYGNSTVLVEFSDTGNAADGSQSGVSGGAMPGVSQFQFADGTVLSRADLIAQATLLPNDFNPTVTATGVTVMAGQPIAASTLFTANDAPDNPITWYQVSSDGGGYFQLYGKALDTPYVSQDQLAHLIYVGGSSGSSDNVQISAFDGAVWSAPITISVRPAFSATTFNQLVVGADDGPDTLVGGFDGDTLQGNTNQDTFVINAGGGNETIQEQGAIYSSSPNENVVQFGSGITPSAIQLSAGADGTLVMNLDSAGDEISMMGFNPNDPINTYEFADGSSLDFLQLISGSTPNSGTVDNSDGSTTAYSFNAGGSTLYSAQVTNADGQLIGSSVIASDGTSSSDTYTYNSDGSYTDTIETLLPGSTVTTIVDSYDTEGRIVDAVTTNPDGYNSDTATVYNDDGSYTKSTNTNNVDGSSVFSQSTVSATGQLLEIFAGSSDGSSSDYLYSDTGQPLGIYLTGADGSSNDSTFTYNDDGTYSDSMQITTAEGATTNTFNLYDADNALTFSSASSYDARGLLLSAETTNADASVDSQSYEGGGRLASAGTTLADGAAATALYSFNLDGSWSDTTTLTSAGGDSISTVYSYNAAGQLQSADPTSTSGSTTDHTYDGDDRVLTTDIITPDGSTQNSSYDYNVDGSYTDTVVSTPLGDAATTTVYSYDTSGDLQSANTSNADGSTSNLSYNSQGRIAAIDVVDADGSTRDSSFAYSGSDASYTDTLVSTPAGGLATTSTYDYNAEGQLQSVDVANPDGSLSDRSYDTEGDLVNSNNYVPYADGSYADSWSKSDGSSGTYWWSASTGEYMENWYNADGSSFTDTYQYATGGSPANSGFSFTETFTDSSGDSGSRVYDATTGTTTVSWDSTLTGPISGTSPSDSGFIGLQLNGETTNTANDPTYFNPLLSSAFNDFLTAHG